MRRPHLLSGLAALLLMSGSALADGLPIRGTSPLSPLVNTTVNVPTNVAAGLGNTARQATAIGHGPGMARKVLGGISVDLFGRSALVDTTVNVPTNVSAGIANSARQAAALPR